MTENQRRKLIKAQQSELDGVETYLMLADIVNNEADKEAFKKLAADEGRHASVFKLYTGENIDVVQRLVPDIDMSRSQQTRRKEHLLFLPL